MSLMQTAGLSAGAAILAAAWLAPLIGPGGHSFSAHMTAHMAVVAVAAPLLALGVAGSAADPARRWPALFAAIPASLLEFGVVWIWHAPALHDGARERAALYVAEQASFLIAGLVLWLAVLGGAPQARTMRAGTGVLALVLTFAHMTLLGALLALTPRPLYGHATLADQHVGGVIMLAVGGASYLAGTLWLARDLLRHHGPAAPR